MTILLVLLEQSSLSKKRSIIKVALSLLNLLYNSYDKGALGERDKPTPTQEIIRDRVVFVTCYNSGILNPSSRTLRVQRLRCFQPFYEIFLLWGLYLIVYLLQTSVYRAFHARLHPLNISIPKFRNPSYAISEAL